MLTAFEFPLVKYIQEEDHWGAGWYAICIRSPRLSKVSDPGNYDCRKGFLLLTFKPFMMGQRGFSGVTPVTRVVLTTPRPSLILGIP